jgi:hypothetical protein
VHERKGIGEKVEEERENQCICYRTAAVRVAKFGYLDSYTNNCCDSLFGLIWHLIEASEQLAYKSKVDQMLCNRNFHQV